MHGSPVRVLQLGGRAQKGGMRLFFCFPGKKAVLRKRKNEEFFSLWQVLSAGYEESAKNFPKNEKKVFDRTG